MAKARKEDAPVIDVNPIATPTMVSVGIEFCPETKLYQAIILHTRGSIVVSRETSNPDVRQAALDAAYQIFLERIVSHGL